MQGEITASLYPLFTLMGASSINVGREFRHSEGPAWSSASQLPCLSPCSAGVPPTSGGATRRGRCSSPSRRPSSWASSAATRSRAEASVAAQFRNPVAVIINISEHLAEHRLALHEKPDVMLVGHPDAAVHLDPFAHRERRDVGGLGLGDRNMKLRPLVA